MFKLGGLKQLTPGDAIDKLEANDPSLKVCDLSKSAVLQMKGPELIPKLAAALAKNTVCQELILIECNINDSLAAVFGEALAKNNVLAHLDLSDNKIGNDGATALANGIASNQTLMQLNLFGQKGTKFGDATLHAFTAMFDKNVTLLKIIWRLESRQSFALNKKVVRNNDIDRRIKAGKDYADLLPTGVAPLSAALVAQRSASLFQIGTPRGSSAGDSARFSSDSARNSSSEENRGPPPKIQLPKENANPQPAAPARAPSVSGGGSDELTAALSALDVEYERELAALKARFAERKSALLRSGAVNVS